MPFFNDFIREAHQDGLREEEGRAASDADRSVSFANIERLHQAIADLLKEMRRSLAELDEREVGAC